MQNVTYTHIKFRSMEAVLRN